MNILLVSPLPPWPANRGGNQRTALIYSALSEVGSVDLMLLSSEAVISNEQKEILENDFNMVARFGLPGRGEKGPWRILYRMNPMLANRLAHLFGSHKMHYTSDGEASQWLKEQVDNKKYDLVVCRYLLKTAQTGALNFSPTIVDVDDLDTQKYESRLDAPGLGFIEKIILKIHLNKFQKVTPSVLKLADHLWFTNVHDQDRIGMHDVSSILPNIPYTKELSKKNVAPDSNSSSAILAVCAMNFGVNERGIDRFLRIIWPEILALAPHANFILVGSGMSDAQIEKWQQYKNVEVRGYVDKLEDVYAESAFTVAPIFEGGGTKIKVAESFIFQRTCVVSHHAHRGYEDILLDSESLLVARSDGEFARHCVNLLNNPDRRKQMASLGYSRVSDRLSYQKFKATVKDTVRRVGAG